MEIALTPDLERQLTAAVASGQFASTSEAVSEGLRRLFADQDAEIDLPEWLTIDASSDGTVPAALAAALDSAAEDLRLGRTVSASEVLAEIDAKISTYFARRDASLDR